jgi:hypothetical protein
MVIGIKARTDALIVIQINLSNKTVTIVIFQRYMSHLTKLNLFFSRDLYAFLHTSTINNYIIHCVPITNLF